MMLSFYVLHFTFDRGLRFWSGLLLFEVHRGCWGFHMGLFFERVFYPKVLGDLG